MCRLKPFFALECQPVFAFKYHKELSAAFLCALASVAGINLMSLSTQVLIADVGFSSGNVSWATSLYILAEVIALPTMPFLVKRLGIHGLLLWACLVFTVGTVLCMLSSTPTAFLAGRLLQGAAGGLLLPLANTMIKHICDPKDTQNVSAFFSAMLGAAPVLGALWGGLTSDYGIEWVLSGVFFVLLWSLFLIFRHPPTESKLGIAPTEFPLAPVIMGIGLSLLVYQIDEMPEQGFLETTLQQWLFITACCCLMFGLCHEALIANPTLNIHLLRNLDFGLVCTAGFFSGVVVYGFLFTFPYYFTVIRGYAPSEIIPLLLMAAIPQLFIVRLISRWCQKRNPGIVASLGAFLFAITAVLSSDISYQTTISDMWFIQGIRAFASPMLVVALGSMLLYILPTHQVSDGLTIYALSRILGGAIGVSGFLSFAIHQQQITILSGWGTFQASSLPLSIASLNEIQVYAWDFAFQQAYLLLSILLIALSVFLFYSSKHTANKNI